jgi:membrane protease YdiL (CAAX protease family)
MNEKLTGRDWTLIAVCCGLVALSLFVVFNWFYAAFPEASIEFRYTRDTSLPLAARVLDADVRTYEHAAVFDGDELAKIFLERTLGLANANRVMRNQVRVWWWHHRWFKPLQEEEFQVDVAPTGEIVSFFHKIPEDRALPSGDSAAARRTAETFLTRIGAKLSDLQLVAQSDRALPHRTQRIFTWDSQSVRPAGAPYRHTVTIDGDRVSRYEQRVRVPDQWERDYREMRSKNLLAGKVDDVFLLITIVAAVVVFITRLLRGDVHLRLIAGVAVVAFILGSGSALNSFPIAKASYDTAMTYPAFLARVLLGAFLLSGIGAALLIALVVGSGEVMYRERLPQHLAIPRLWQRKALASKRVFLSFVIGYTLVAFFLAYQVAFYLIAEKFGAWSPAEVPYDEMLNTAFPWIAVLFAGFFPALSEEFISRAFSIPFFERIFRNRLFAIILAGFIWGFGHATYPNQPFFIRGLEVGLAGVILGFLLFRFGLVPLLIWHYTVDALYTALLLFRSGNAYYVVSAGVASLAFAIPMLISIALYIKNRGFIPDEDLSNATIPIRPAPVRGLREIEPIAYPPAEPVSKTRLLACIAVVAIACLLAATRPASIDDVIDYRITGDEAKRIAEPFRDGAKTYTAAQPGFRSWDPNGGGEDGGGASGPDQVALDYLFRHGMPVPKIVDVMRTKIPTATWMVRSFAPLQKEESRTEVDPRKSQVVGYHRYLDEKKPGARLEQPQALAIARNIFPRFHETTANVDLREALSFQQPNRRDWLFHFQERAPLVAEAFRRVSVRVAGDQVTQFAATIKIPDQAYRDAAKTTFLNVVLLVLFILGVIALLALTVAGFVMAARREFPWRRPAMLTAVLGIIPIVAAVLQWKNALFTYDTTQSWTTYINSQIVSAIMVCGVQIGLIFLALAGIEAAHPKGLDWLRREGRARFGRPALVAAVTAIGLLVIWRVALQAVGQLIPSAGSPGSIRVSQAVNIAWPAALDIVHAAVWTTWACAAIALFARAVRTMPRAQKLADITSILTLFFALIQPNTNGSETALMLLTAATGALLVWALVRFVLRENLLAYPLAIAISILLAGAAMLLENHRADLIVNGAIDIVAAIALIVFMVYPRSQPQHA